MNFKKRLSYRQTKYNLKIEFEKVLPKNEDSKGDISETQIEKYKGPGPQVENDKSKLGSFALKTLVFVSLLISIHAIIHENLALTNLQQSDKLYSLFSWEIMDLDGAMTLLIGALGVVAVRYQIAQSMKPHLNYKGEALFQSKLLGNKKVWRITLFNIGSGLAEIQKVIFRVKLGENELGIIICQKMILLNISKKTI